MRIAVLGGSGELGTDVVKIGIDRGHDVVGTKSGQVEVISPRSITGFLHEAYGRARAGWPGLVINCAAFRDITGCEGSPFRAFAVNAIGVRQVAEVCRQLGAQQVYISTDYIFDGRQRRAENDSPSPLNVYGVSKVAGEHFALASGGTVVRTAALFGHGFPNFIERMLAAEDPEVVTDQTTTPTSTRDMATRLFEIIERGASGIFHVVNSSPISWWDFAHYVRQKSNLSPPRARKTQPDEIPRPMFSWLRDSRCLDMGLAPMRDSYAAIDEYLAAR